MYKILGVVRSSKNEPSPEAPISWEKVSKEESRMEMVLSGYHQEWSQDTTHALSRRVMWLIPDLKVVGSCLGNLYKGHLGHPSMGENEGWEEEWKGWNLIVGKGLYFREDHSPKWDGNCVWDDIPPGTRI